MHYTPEQFGAVGDGVALDTAALQCALDACAGTGGCVRLAAGKTYLSGSLTLGAHTDLHLEPGATLLASPNLAHYYAPGTVDNADNRGVGTPVTRGPAFVFLHAAHVSHLRFTGTGRIDGNGGVFMHRVNPYYATGDFYPRPTLLYLEDCDHLRLRDITLQNAPFWTLHTAGCRDVEIDHITIDNPLDWANSDGIDPDHCQNVRIKNCRISCADDCICLKNTRGAAAYPGTRDVHISGCRLCSTSAAIKIGTEGVDDFADILVEDCVIEASNRGVSIQIRDGGSVSGAVFRNLQIQTRRFSPDWWGSAEPIALTAFDRDENTHCGSISNVRFEHIQAQGENGVLLCGQDGRIHDITLEDVHVTLQTTSRWPHIGYDLRPGSAPAPFLDCPTQPFLSIAAKR
ncbi:MAG: glycoside hydrolase family 28 protein [Oscillospiraceae bacterium]|jgi:polygalacturonase|nr:glycoside hydrolase family 28 protein [Oscillospiraceae bacterium]